MATIDYYAAIEELIPNANYRGLINNQHDYEYLDWLDERDKPFLEAIVAANFIVLKKKKKDQIAEWRTQKLAQGYLTSYGFKVDIEPEDISNWGSTLTLLNLLDFRVHISIQTMTASYPELTLDVIHATMVDAYLYPNASESLNIPSTENDVVALILKEFRVKIRDYNNDIQLLSIDQYKFMCIETGDYYKEQYDRKWVLDNDVNNAKFPDELDAIVW